jgi:hypothetical protein
MAVGRKFTDEQRSLIVRLYTVEHRTQADIQKLCAQGIYGLEAFSISKAGLSELLRNERVNTSQAIQELSLADAFDRLARKALSIGDRELERINAKQGPVDADHFLKLTRALRELQPLAKPQANNQGTERQTFLGSVEGQQPSEQGTNEEQDESDSPSEPTNEGDSPINGALPLAA